MKTTTPINHLTMGILNNYIFINHSQLGGGIKGVGIATGGSINTLSPYCPAYYCGILYGSNCHMSHWAHYVAISRGVTHNAGPVAIHNTGFEPRFWAQWGLQVLKLLYVVYFSTLVATLANVATYHTGCPVATIQNATVWEASMKQMHR